MARCKGLCRILQRNRLLSLGQKKKKLCCPHPTKIWKLGRSVGFFFFFFLRTVRELSFPIFFLKFLNGENSGGMQSKRIYTSAFLSHWIHILANSSPKSDIKKKKKKKKTRPCFFAFYGRSGEGNITNFFWGGLIKHRKSPSRNYCCQLNE